MTQLSPPRAQDDQATRLRAILREAHPIARAAPEAPPRLHAPPTIAIASGKGGVGKSFVAVSLSLAIAESRSVTLIDADFGAANADVMLGVAPLRRLDECFQTRFAPGRRPIDIAIDVAPGLRLVPGAVGARHLPHAHDRAALLDRLVDFAQSAGTLVIDTAAGVHDAVTDMLAAADCPVIVTTPEPTAIADAYALLKSLHHAHGPDPASRVMLLVNQVTDKQAALRVHRRISAVSDRFLGIRPALAGLVPRHPQVTEAVKQQQLTKLKRRSPPARALRSIAAGLSEAAASAQQLRTGDASVHEPGLVRG